MANKLYDESAVSAIAAAIRGKNGLTTQYKIADMAAAIAAIPGGVPYLTKVSTYTVASAISRSPDLYTYLDIDSMPVDEAWLVLFENTTASGNDRNAAAFLSRKNATSVYYINLALYASGTQHINSDGWTANRAVNIGAGSTITIYRVEWRDLLA